MQIKRIISLINLVLKDINRPAEKDPAGLY